MLSLKEHLKYEHLMVQFFFILVENNLKLPKSYSQNVIIIFRSYTIIY